MRRAILTAGAVITLGIPLSAAAPPVLAQAGTFAYAECPIEMPPGEVEGETVDCGYLTVPADHADPRGPTIDLAVAILYAEADEPQPDPVVYLEGGPGGETITDFDSWRGYPLLDDRDLVLFDQRGTGWSIPLLDCPDEIDELDGAEYAAALAACRDELLAEGVDLALFDSRQSAADVEALREALGYEQWNLYGISYGTRLALTVMRDYPEGVRSAVLDSVYPPQVYTLEELASDELAGLESMFDGCAADRACQAAYPYLEWDFYDVIDTLEAEPKAVEYTDDDGEPYSEELTASDFFATVVGALSNPDQLPWLPAVIDALADGDARLYADLATDYLPSPDGYIRRALPSEPDGDAMGMYLSVECSEEVAFIDPELVQADIESLPESLQSIASADAESLLADCAVWAVPVAADIEAEAVESDIPTLLIAGQYDTITPPAWAWDTADSLSDSYVFVYPAMGHSVTSDAECAQTMTAAFLDDPTTEPDSTCVREMGPPDWVVRGRSWLR